MQTTDKLIKRGLVRGVVRGVAWCVAWCVAWRGAWRGAPNAQGWSIAFKWLKKTHFFDKNKF